MRKSGHRGQQRAEARWRAQFNSIACCLQFTPDAVLLLHEVGDRCAFAVAERKLSFGRGRGPSLQPDTNCLKP